MSEMTRTFIGEALGTMTLILLGDGVVAGVLLKKSKAENAGWIVISTGWGLAVMGGIFVAKAFGGAGMLNPVGPVFESIIGGTWTEKYSALVMGQFVGAFVGAILVYVHFWPHWRETTDPGLKRAVFCTAPAIRSPLPNFLSELIATFALAFVAGSIGKATVGSLEPVVLAGLIWSIGLSLGGTTGYAINPARDLSPRLAHALLPIPGKGHSDWGYAWIPVLGPIAGAALAAVVTLWYDSMSG